MSIYFFNIGHFEVYLSQVLSRLLKDNIRSILTRYLHMLCSMVLCRLDGHFYVGFTSYSFHKFTYLIKKKTLIDINALCLICCHMAHLRQKFAINYKYADSFKRVSVVFFGNSANYYQINHSGWDFWLIGTFLELKIDNLLVPL